MIEMDEIRFTFHNGLVVKTGSQQFQYRFLIGVEQRTRTLPFQPVFSLISLTQLVFQLGSFAALTVTKFTSQAT